MYAVLCPPEGFGAGLGCGLVGIDLEGLLIALEVLVGALEGVPDLTCTFVDTLDFVLGNPAARCALVGSFNVSGIIN